MGADEIVDWPQQVGQHRYAQLHALASITLGLAVERLMHRIHKSARTCESAPMRKIERILISAADRERLERLVRDRNTPQKVVWRARIVLLASEGLTAEGIGAAVGKSLLTVRRWRYRFEERGVDGLLKDATRPSRVKPLAAEKIAQVVHMTVQEKPPNATHWSVRSMAKAAGISYSSVQRIWYAHGLKPHLVDTFKVSRDKNFVAKVEDVVGLYLNPPDKALVLCV